MFVLLGAQKGNSGRPRLPNVVTASDSFPSVDPEKKREKHMSAKQLNEDEFRDRFDAGESLESLGFDLNKAVVEQPEVKRVNVDFPEQIVAKLDRHAAQMGITRQSLIKVWIFERLKDESAKSAIDHAHFLSFEQRLRAALMLAYETHSGASTK